MSSRKKYTPTPEQIRASCLLLQEKWTDKDEEKRKITKSKAWIPPIVYVPDEYQYIDLPSDY